MSEREFGFYFHVVVILVVGAICWMFASYECSAKWEKSGMATDWGPIQGCLIKRDGKWIPSENYREIP